MGIFDKIFEKNPAADSRQASPPPSTGIPQDGVDSTDSKAEPVGSLQVVFSAPKSYSPAKLQAELSKLLPSATIHAEAMAGTYEQGTPVTRLTWNDRVVDVVGFDVPMPSKAVEGCVQGAHYAQPVKSQVRAQKAHAILYSSGPGDVMERYVASAIVAAAMASLGGVGVLNCNAMTSLPAEVVRKMAAAVPNADMLRHLPLLLLYCGFVKYETPDGSVWMRTYNCPAFDLPDLAMRRDSHARGKETSDMFDNLLAYLRSSGKRFAPGHTAQVGGNLHVRFRAPRDDEPFPTHTAGQLLILEEFPAA